MFESVHITHLIHVMHPANVTANRFLFPNPFKPILLSRTANFAIQAKGRQLNYCQCLTFYNRYQKRADKIATAAILPSKTKWWEKLGSVGINMAKRCCLCVCYSIEIPLNHWAHQLNTLKRLFEYIQRSHEVGKSDDNNEYQKKTTTN